MQKKLFTQIKNEWRGNLWLAAELLIVSVVMWYITDTLYCELSTYMEPRGFDTGHCYKIDMGELTAKSPDYRPYTTQEERAADVREFVERLRRRPEVEAVSLSVNAYPYNGSSSGANVSLDTLHVHGYCIRRFVTPDFMRVFRYRGTRGETPEQLSGILERGEFLASDNLYQRNYGLTMTSLVGREFHLMDDTTETCRLGAALVPVRYHDYYPAWASYSMVYNLNTLSIDFITSGCELCLRVKAGEDRDFIARLKADSESQFRIGNIYMADAVSFTELRRSFLQSWTNNMRYFLTGMGFLLFNIFLGLFGTFWFRTQQRRPEIALHKALGATDSAVFLRLLCEGLLLLALVTPLALLVDYHLADAELNASLNGTTLEWGRLLGCAAFTFLLIALMIVTGIGIPARRAMRVQPAEALHDE